MMTMIEGSRNDMMIEGLGSVTEDNFRILGQDLSNQQPENRLQ